MRTSYLHIGTHKTATTSIQAVLDSTRDALAQHGILYPLAGIKRPYYGHHDLSHELRSPPDDLGTGSIVRQVLDEIASSTHDVIISAEGLSLAVRRQSKFRSFIDALQRHTPRIVIVVYFRNQADYVRSLYFTLLQFGRAESFDRFLSEVLRDGAYRTEGMTFSFCYRDLLACLPSGPHIEIVVRDYDEVKSSGVVADFLKIVGAAPSDVGMTVEPIENLAQGIPDAFVRFCRGRPATSDDRWLAEVMADAFGTRTVHLDSDSRRRILAAFDDSNRHINARFPNCRLPTIDTAAAAIDDDLKIDHVFSDVTLQMAAAMERWRNGALAERDPAAHDRDAITQELERVTGEYWATMQSFIELRGRHIALESKHSALASAKRKIVSEHAMLAAAHACLERDLSGLNEARQTLSHDYDALFHNYDALSRDHHFLTIEHNAVTAKLAQATETQAEVMTSLSWRFTAPLRWLAKYAARIFGRNG